MRNGKFEVKEESTSRILKRVVVMVIIAMIVHVYIVVKTQPTDDFDFSSDAEFKKILTQLNKS